MKQLDLYKCVHQPNGKEFTFYTLDEFEVGDIVAVVTQYGIKSAKVVRFIRIAEETNYKPILKKLITEELFNNNLNSLVSDETLNLVNNDDLKSYKISRQ